MANKPVLFAVDDDREVLRAVERDLRRKYGRGRNGDGYRILSADSAAAAMEALEKLARCGETPWHCFSWTSGCRARVVWSFLRRRGSSSRMPKRSSSRPTRTRTRRSRQ